ncbi:MAG: hypothetical protein V3T77_00650 [Planctomycetota bacterium]
MSPRERVRPVEPQEPTADSPAENQRLDDYRQAAQDLLDAGDEAISRALSGNSQAFNDANVQEGGQ